METIDRSIQEEVHRLGERSASDYEVAVQVETAARATFDQQKALASRIAGDAVALRLARQEAEASRTLYTTLLGRLQQTGVLEGLHSGNFTVVSPALVPSREHQTSPNLLLLSAAALGMGMMLGCTAAVARELTDNAIRSVADLAGLVDAPVLAAVPAHRPPVPWHRRMYPSPISQPLSLENP